MPPQRPAAEERLTRGFLCCSSGNVTDDVIAKYIAEQNINQDEDVKVDS
jgi:hypothetical protein